MRCFKCKLLAASIFVYVNFLYNPTLMYVFFNCTLNLEKLFVFNEYLFMLQHWVLFFGKDGRRWRESSHHHGEQVVNRSAVLCCHLASYWLMCEKLKINISTRTFQTFSVFFLWYIISPIQCECNKTSSWAHHLACKFPSCYCVLKESL